MYRLLKYLRGIKVPQNSDSQTVGNFGERLAKRFLRQEKRLRIICKNWKDGFREIDLIAWDGPVMVFVEVRTRNMSAAVSGYYSISTKKKLTLSKACKAYMKALRNPPRNFRFDIVEVGFDFERKVKINHYENVTLFEKDYRPQYIR